MDFPAESIDEGDVGAQEHTFGCGFMTSCSQIIPNYLQRLGSFVAVHVGFCIPAPLSIWGCLIRKNAHAWKMMVVDDSRSIFCAQFSITMLSEFQLPVGIENFGARSEMSGFSCALFLGSALIGPGPRSTKFATVFDELLLCGDT